MSKEGLKQWIETAAKIGRRKPEGNKNINSPKPPSEEEFVKFLKEKEMVDTREAQDAFFYKYVDKEFGGKKLNKINRDRLAGMCLTRALCEFKKTNGDRDPGPGGYSESIMAEWLETMRLAKYRQEKQAGEQRAKMEAKAGMDI